MPVMDVGIMCVLVPQRRVMVPMGVRFAGRIVSCVRVLMVCVMYVSMFVIHRFVRVFVVVVFG